MVGVAGWMEELVFWVRNFRCMRQLFRGELCLFSCRSMRDVVHGYIIIGDPDLVRVPPFVASSSSMDDGKGEQHTGAPLFYSLGIPGNFSVTRCGVN